MSQFSDEHTRQQTIIWTINIKITEKNKKKNIAVAANRPGQKSITERLDS